jgi:hypothetical protein
MRAPAALKGAIAMKVTIEVDCTPEEARRMMGLPDLTPLHERYLAKLAEAVDKGGAPGPELLGQLMKNWAPVGDAGMDFWRGIMAGGTKPSS